MGSCQFIVHYNSKVSGLINYYSFSANRTSFVTLYYQLKLSLRCTLRKKYKLRSSARAVKKFGSDLGINLENGKRVDFTVYRLFRNLPRSRCFITTHSVSLTNLHRIWSKKYTSSNLGKTCIVCGDSPCEIHNIKQIHFARSRKNPNFNWWERGIKSINRKQVPLCSRCHRKIHCDTFSPAEMDAFKSGCRGLLNIKPNH